MAEHRDDNQDRYLRTLFAEPPIADDGFSRRVVRKIRRRLWVDRLAMPVAILIAAAVAARSFAGIAAVLPALGKALPVDVGVPSWVASLDLTTLALGVAGAIVFVFVLQLAED
jgi:hypothetical protein